MPTTNSEFWSKKFRRTLERDRRALRELEKDGWATAIIWECQLETGIGHLIDTLNGTSEAKQLKTPVERTP